MRDPRASINELIAFLELDDGPQSVGETRRLLRTAVTQLASVRNPSEPDEVLWLLTNRRLLAERLLVGGAVGSSTVSSYASRVKFAAEAFLGVSLDGPAEADIKAARRRELERDHEERVARNRARHVPPPSGLTEEVADLMNHLGRWPTMQRFILRAMADALDAAVTARGK